MQNRDMSWERRILRDIELGADLAEQNLSYLPDRVSALIAHQRAHWRLLREGQDQLPHVESKPILLGDYEIFAQFNPGRIVSTTAKVDYGSVSGRPCFLCAENLPPEEKGIAFGEHWIILCNPFPILDGHLSIVHRRHTAQAIAGNFEALLALARELDGRHFVLYNGPESGASAPDHLHFQACARRGLPIEAHLRAIEADPAEQSNMIQFMQRPRLELLTFGHYHLRVLIARSSDPDAIGAWFYSTLERLRELLSRDREPLINLIIVYDEPRWTVYFFPRAKHRPARYYAENHERLTVSPAAIDLAGFLVMPIRDHFDRIRPVDTQELFAEVTLSPEVFSELLATLRRPELRQLTDQT